tara:strand:- start:278 stop:391 length:114 start_codon:yes stop_codon:yes gene_type:complete
VEFLKAAKLKLLSHHWEMAVNGWKTVLFCIDIDAFLF